MTLCTKILNQTLLLTIDSDVIYGRNYNTLPYSHLFPYTFTFSFYYMVEA